MNKKLNILIPMAGAGSRFQQAGYNLPKPLIDVKGKPMIQHVVENIALEGKYIFIVQKEHYEKYSLKYILKLIKPDCEIIITDGLTEGAACTTLLAKDLINSDDALLIANSDQWIDWAPNHFYDYVNRRNADGAILSFISNSPKHSYSKIEDGYITEVAEKKVISNHATVGIYYWKKGRDYVDCANSMIEKNIRHNNEFYVCPVYNQLIEKGGMVLPYAIPQMHGMGTPEELNKFLSLS
tara:strand:- start:302 stop:1018 length:717 start_codon:yes stop_codon:yes gene_type:complete